MKPISLKHRLRYSFLLLASLTLLPTTESQAQERKEEIRLEVTQKPLSQVFRQLEKSTDYKFMFSHDDVKGLQVTRKVQAGDIETVLKQLLEGLPLTYSIKGKFVYIVPKKGVPAAVEQSKKTVRGQVVDAAGNPLPGVSILVKGTKTGTATDLDGNYSLDMPAEGHTLLFSMIGMKNVEERVGKRTNVNVTMEENAEMMDEVVVTGYQQLKKNAFTGNATVVTKDQLLKTNNKNAIAALQAFEPSFRLKEANLWGSDPNNLPEFTIRGESSIGMNRGLDVESARRSQRTNLADNPNLPIFILDGFEISLTRFMDLDESQVESITLLKDANATALYGSKGSNGVVVITSKPIEPGKLRFSYKGTLQIEAPDLTSYNLMNAREKLEYERLAGLYEDDNMQTYNDLQALYNQRRMDVERGVDTYWMKYPIRTGIGSRHNISIEGGDEHLRYGANLTYNNVAGAMKGSDRNTLSGNMFLQYRYKNFSFQNNLQITNTTSKNSPYGSFSEYCALNSYYTPYDEEGNLKKELEDFFYPMTGDRNTVYNPLYNAYLPRKDSSEYTDITNNFSVEWYILPELFLRGQFSYTKETSRSDVYYPASDTMFDNYTGDDYKRKGQYIYGTGDSQSYEGRFTLNYSKTFKDLHQLFAGLGITVSESKAENYTVVGEGISVDNMDFLGMANQYEESGRPSGTESISRGFGALFNLNYTYDRRYFIDLNGKYDGSSQFGSNKHFAPFWSTGVGWNIQNEKFMENVKWINIARLRLSYGITGSQNFASYLSIRSYQDFGGLSTQNWYGVYLMAYGNPDLQWQKTSQWNVGLDMELLNRRLTFSIDVYNKLTNDLLADVNMPISSGFESYKANVGKVENRGYELSASAQIIRNVEQDLRWTVGVKMAHNENKVKEISNSLENLNEDLLNQDTYNPSFIYREGQSMNTIYAVPSKGIDPSTGREIFVKRDGTETFEWEAEDQVPCGVAEPKIQGTLNSNLRWKGITLNMVFGYRWGGKAYNSTLASKVENIAPYDNADRRVLYDRWSEPGDIALYKGVQDMTETRPTSRFVFKDNTFYCSSLNLGYEVPTEWTQKHFRISYLAINGYLEDLFYKSTIKRERGTDYPFSRKFSLSLTVRF
mgnify:CR=1 FL=1